MLLIGNSTAYSGGQAALFFWIISSFIAASIIWGIWNLEVRERNSSQAKEVGVEKKKREHIDSVLRDLSDEDLLRLRRRLLDGTINDERLEDALVGEDGEIVYEGRR
jgi:hypothetical protein